MVWNQEFRRQREGATRSSTADSRLYRMRQMQVTERAKAEPALQPAFPGDGLQPTPPKKLKSLLQRGRERVPKGVMPLQQIPGAQSRRGLPPIRPRSFPSGSRTK